MSRQPEALRLADRLDLWGDQGDLLEAASELRRQHAEIERLRAALKGIVEFVDAPVESKRPDVFALRINKARAALKGANHE